MVAQQGLAADLRWIGGTRPARPAWPGLASARPVHPGQPEDQAPQKPLQPAVEPVTNRGTGLRLKGICAMVQYLPAGMMVNV